MPPCPPGPTRRELLLGTAVLTVPGRGAVVVPGRGAVLVPTAPPPAAPAVTTPAAPVVLPAGARYARDCRNGWGVNAPFDSSPPARTATAMGYLGTRWARMQFSGDNRSAMTGLQAALVAAGVSDPTLRLQVLLNGYISNAAANTLADQEGWIMSLLGTTGPTGASILRAIEGVNECNNPYVGQGSRGPSDDIYKISMGPSGPAGVTPDPIADANFVDWSTQLHTFIAGQAGLASVEILSPTVIYFLGADFPSDLNVTGLVDYGTYHYYAGAGGGTGGTPSQVGNPGNLTKTYSYAQAGICPGVPMVMSEGGASTEAGGTGYSQQAAAVYHLIAMLDFFRIGGHRTMIYNLFNNDASTERNVTTSNEDNFGVFWPDGSPKPGAIALRNMQDLLSLNLDADDPANLTDTANFTPGYDGSTLSVSGLTNAGTSGSSLVLPKSDGTTMLAIWREPTINNDGTYVVAPADEVSLGLGGSYAWRVFDVSGGRGAGDFTVARSTTPIATGGGSVVLITLYDVPVLVEVS